MSVIQEFIQENTSEEIIEGPLGRIKNIMNEMGTMPDSEFMRCPRNRMELKKNYGDSFLGWKDGVPTFPVRNQYGGMSYIILKKSLNAAKSMFAKTADTRYLKLIKKLESDMTAMKNKTATIPQTYHPQVSVDKLVNNIREY